MKHKIKKAEKPAFDAEGYQTGKPHLQSEPIEFDALEVLPRDFLPSPEELAGKSPQTKITLAVADVTQLF